MSCIDPQTGKWEDIVCSKLNDKHYVVKLGDRHIGQLFGSHHQVVLAVRISPTHTANCRLTTMSSTSGTEYEHDELGDLIYPKVNDGP